MTAKHTPGPWFQGVGEPLLVESKNFQVARFIEHPIAGEAEDNARLTSVAPEMYEAVSPLDKYPDDAGCPDDAMTGVRMSYGELRKIKAAIAKAEGRKP
jgi:hypothetical protein